MKYYLLLLFILFLTTIIHAQNIFDYHNSMQYAKSLIDEKEYELAYQELIRIQNNYSPMDDSHRLLLLQACTYTSRKTELFQGIHLVLAQNKKLSNELLNFSIASCLINDSLSTASWFFINNKDGTYENFNELHVCYYLLKKEYDSAAIIIKTSSYNISDTSFYYELISEAQTFRYKNKAAAVIMSAIIPASGKYYAKQSYDASIGLLITGIYGFLAYRSFNAYGISSVFGWVNVTAFSTFYLGNLWGTGVAIKRYNNSIQLKIRYEIKDKLQNMFGI